MTHISRPLQIALAAMALFVAVWFVALRGHSSSSESTGSSASSGTQAAAPAKPAASASSSSAGSSGSSSSAGGGSVYHGSAPGVEGLTRAIAKARGAVAQSQQNAKQLQEKSAQASSSTSTTSGSAATASVAGKSGSEAARAASTSPSNSSTQAASSASRGAPAQQTLVEGELQHGQTVILLFWDPAGSVDVAVHHDLQVLQGGHAAHVAVHYASAHEVAQFGSLTRSLQVNQTPTMLVIAPGGNTKTLTGLADPYTIQQAISEAHHS